MEEDNDGKHCNHGRVRWCIDATRCVVALLLGVLVVAVFLGTLAAMRFHVDKLDISVANGYVSVAGLPRVSTWSPPPPPAKEVTLSLVLKLSNPSRRGVITFDNISIYFHDDDDGDFNNKKVICSSLNSSVQWVPPDGSLDLSVSLIVGDNEAEIATLVEMTNGTKRFKMGLNATFQTQFTDLNIIPARPRLAVYDCSNVTIGTSPLLKVQAEGDTDVSCQDLSPTKWKSLVRH